MNSDKIPRNQEILIDQYNKLKNEYPNTIIELHNVIEGDAGLSWIPPEVLLALTLDYVFFLYTEADEILKRRILDTSKSRRIATPQELKKIQELSLENLISVFGESYVHTLSGVDAVKQLNNILHSSDN